MSFSLSRGKQLDVANFGILQEDLPHFEQGPINLHDFFPPQIAQNPIEIEIGSGKGTFLVQQAKLVPDVNYLGIEWAKAFWRYAADRCRRNNLQNTRLLRAEAAMFIRNYVHDNAIQQVHIYFPDPWPKKRHHKRRLIQTDFLQHLHRILQPAGQVRIATDHEDYFQWMLDHFNQTKHLFTQLPFDSPQSAPRGELVGTNFERKYRREGRPFHATILIKQ